MARPNARKQLVAAGLSVLHEQGFNATSVEDITVAAGVPKGSFYNHFEGKEALAAEAIDLYDEANILVAGLLEEEIAPLDRLRRYFEGLTRFIFEGGFARGCMLANFSAEVSDHSPLIRGRLKAVYERWTTGLETAIRAGQRSGEIGKQLSAGVLASVLMDAYEGAILRARVEKSNRPIKSFMAVAFAKLLG